jgi:hypothetical protein
MQTMGNKRCIKSGCGMGNKTNTNTHSMGNKSHMMFNQPSKSSTGDNSSSIQENKQLGEYEAVGLSKTSHKNKKSYLEKK